MPPRTAPHASRNARVAAVNLHPTPTLEPPQTPIRERSPPRSIRFTRVSTPASSRHSRPNSTLAAKAGISGSSTSATREAYNPLVLDDRTRVGTVAPLPIPEPPGSPGGFCMRTACNLNRGASDRSRYRITLRVGYLMRWVKHDLGGLS